MKNKKSNSSLTIKLVVTAVLGALGITYIMYKPPVAEINSYQKQSMPKPYKYKKNKSSFTSSENGNGGDSDAISLTGKKGGYDQHVIGKK